MWAFTASLVGKFYFIHYHREFYYRTPHHSCFPSARHSTGAFRALPHFTSPPASGEALLLCHLSEEETKAPGGDRLRVWELLSCWARTQTKLAQLWG